MTQRLLSEEQVDEVARRYEAGETTRELAAAFGCSTQPIFSALRNRGVERRIGGPQPGSPSQGRRFTSDQDEEIAAEYEAGAAIRIIASARGASPAAVHAALKRTGTRRRDGSPNRLFTPEQDEQIAGEYIAGKGMEALAAERGCSAAAIRAVLKRRGVHFRRGGGRRREFTRRQVTEMVRRYGEGESQETLAGDFKTSQNTVSRVLRSHGVKTRMWARGPEAHASWKGGRIAVAGGYIGMWVAPDDPFASMRNTQGYVLEHRLVMARHLGRPLTRTETIHHINGDRSDNRLENLQLRKGKHGKGKRLVCVDCGSENVREVAL